MSGELAGKIAVITGAGSGMGKASVKAFIRHGAGGVVAADISGAEQDTAAEVGDTVVPFHCDVRREADVAAMFDRAVQQFGRVDAVLNVAGIGMGKTFLEITQDDYDRGMDIMMRGVFLGTQYGVKALLNTGGGVIINWSSLAGLNASPRTSVYAAAKAGVIAVTKAAALEHGGDHIRVNAICPGWVLTEGMGKGIIHIKDQLEPKIPMHRIGEPGEIAEVAAFLCSDRASYINGAVINVDGGYSARHP
jgi:NAD(P)-dependent dehydrogenase (short-subunit alcohol dehydrogenase family)